MNSRQLEILTLLAWNYAKQGMRRPARALYEALARLAPQDPRFALALACLELDDGRCAAALELARQAHDLARDASRRRAARMLASRALWGLGQRDEARDALRQAVGMAP